MARKGAEFGGARPRRGFRLRPCASSGLTAGALGFAAGVGILFVLRSLPVLGFTLALTVLSVALAWRLPGLRPLAYGAIGFLWAWTQVCPILCEPFPGSFVGQDIEVTGRIAGLPGRFHDTARFLFRLERARAGGRDMDFAGLVRLTWYRDAPDLVVGERWRLIVRLKPPHGYANPGGFDYERWLFQQDIKATGYVRDAAENLRLDLGPGGYWGHRLRQQLRDRIGVILHGSPGEALVRALVLGDRSGLGPEQWETLARTGTSHLIAISGLHVGMVATFLFFVSRWAWSRCAWLTLIVAAPRAAAIMALTGAAAYSGLAGFAVSTQRALIMLMVVLGAVVAGRTLRAASGIALALVGVLILDPQAVLSYGFWLSFGAVAVLLYTLGHRPAAGPFWSRWGRAQWAVAVGLLPLLLLLFGRASLIAPVVNLVAIPLFSLVLLPVVLVASLLGLGAGLELPLVLTSRVLEWGYGLLEAAAGWNWAAVAVAARPAWVWAAAFAGALLLLLPRGLPGRWLGLVLLSPLVLVRPPAPEYGVAELTLLDVGQGLAVVARTRRHVLVYDTGPRFPSGFNTGGAVVLPYLEHLGVQRIDALVISHGDRDHAGGFEGLRGKIPIGRLLAGEPRELTGAAMAFPCVAGEAWVWDGVDFKILYPAAPGREGNAASCVLRLSARGVGASVLLTGDLGAEGERELVAARLDGLASTVLVAGHHGSNTSTSTEFLEAVAPRYILYAVGFANRFGFPTVAVRARVRAWGAVEFDSASAGAIAFRLLPTGIDGPRAYRAEHPHLWSHRVGGADASF